LFVLQVLFLGCLVEVEGCLVWILSWGFCLSSLDSAGNSVSHIAF
jgi:hypothetical protein